MSEKSQSWAAGFVTAVYMVVVPLMLNGTIPTSASPSVTGLGLGIGIALVVKINFDVYTMEQ